MRRRLRSPRKTIGDIILMVMANDTSPGGDCIFVEEGVVSRRGVPLTIILHMYLVKAS
jgi:hypothetical protein